jgi:hypothetical protein
VHCLVGLDLQHNKCRLANVMMVRGNYKEASTNYHTEHDDQVVDTHTLYLGDPGFKSQPREWLS